MERRGERVLPRVEDCECECTISTDAVLVRVGVAVPELGELSELGVGE